MLPRLWVPLIHWLWARNWNWAAAGAALTASRVANRVAVSTPLRVEVSVLVMVVSPSGAALRAQRWVGKSDGLGAGGLELARYWAAGQVGGLDVDGLAELFLQFDECGYGWVGGQRVRQLEDLPQGAVAPVLVVGQRGGVVGVAAQCPVECDGEQFGVAVGVGQAVAGDRVAVVAGIADQGPAGAVGAAHLVGRAQHAGDR